jgi:hypothetical protein
MQSDTTVQKHSAIHGVANLISEEVFSSEERELFQEVVRALHSIRFGSVALTIHEGKLVEIQKTEKIRRKNPG